jgi:hypothetical protein
MKPSAEDLLGYLLGALEPDEHRQVDRLVSQRPELQAELVELRERLVPLARLEDAEADSAAESAAGAGREADFPAGLARRACEFVSRHSRVAETQVAEAQVADARVAESRAVEVPVAEVRLVGVGADGGSADGGSFASLVAGPSPVGMTPVTRDLATGELAAGRDSWQVSDFIVVAAVAMLAVSILAPAILASRNQARLAACQDNLRRVGMGLFNYAEAHHNRFVPIARTGPLNVAGAYAPVLKEGGFVAQDRHFFCAAALQDGVSEYREIPSLAELEKAFRENNQQLSELQSLMGGSYGYSLGYYEQDQYIGPMNLGRSFRVMMADAPSYVLGNRNSANHDGSGVNMLFEDGSVRFSQTASVGTAGDSIFLNRHGLVAAGADVHDSVIGSSNVSAWISPGLYRN